MSMKLPYNQFVSQMRKSGKIQRFCEYIGYLFFCINSSDSNGFILNTSTEMMIFESYMFSSRSIFLTFRHCNCTTIIFKHLTKKIYFDMLIFRTSFNSFISTIIRGTSRTACDNAIYSASVVLNAIFICNLLDHKIGHPAYMITYPVLDIRYSALSASVCIQPPAKSAST